MAENVYAKTLTETIPLKQYKIQNETRYETQKPTNVYKSVRKASPRPFQFEYKSSTPYPFRKILGTRNWLESYRNAQRMKNLQEIMVYLGKTFGKNAKVGDLHTIPTQTHIAFSRIHIKPQNSESTTNIFSNLNKVDLRRQFDPLFTFKPDNPGDVNLLAEDFLRFSPVFINKAAEEQSPRAHFRYETTLNRNKKCEKSNNNVEISNEFENINRIDFKNQYSFRSTTFDSKSYDSSKIESQQPINTSSEIFKKIYITTLRPTIQFKTRSTMPVIDSNFRHQSLHMTPEKGKEKTNVISKPKMASITDDKIRVHANVFPTKIASKNDEISKSEVTASRNQRYDEVLRMYNASEVEDYHAESFGIISVTTPRTLPQATSMTSFFDSTVLLPEHTWPTHSPDIIKFSREDAKVPDQYLTMKISEDTTTATSIFTTQYIKDNVEYNDKNDDIVASTLIIKLVNNVDSTTQSYKKEKSNRTYEYKVNKNTYVPQINGHYRNMEHNTRRLMELLKENSEKYRIKRLKSLTTVRTPTYVPMYVEIKRNHTKQHNENNESNTS
ncbi:unnamed protein product [Parnassius apollo]|uniref:(apollo) hypothetical protein n=1 Tax=Parnassius apollo TaxID=110799 RepID=A0A8S3XZQ4_PARAO|nr:unnamed protein product [Parnassius apollo]